MKNSAATKLNETPSTTLIVDPSLTPSELSVAITMCEEIQTKVDLSPALKERARKAMIGAYTGLVASLEEYAEMYGIKTIVEQPTPQPTVEPTKSEKKKGKVVDMKGKEIKEEPVIAPVQQPTVQLSDKLDFNRIVVLNTDLMYKEDGGKKVDIFNKEELNAIKTFPDLQKYLRSHVGKVDPNTLCNLYIDLIIKNDYIGCGEKLRDSVTKGEVRGIINNFKALILNFKEKNPVEGKITFKQAEAEVKVLLSQGKLQDAKNKAHKHFINDQVIDAEGKLAPRYANKAIAEMLTRWTKEVKADKEKSSGIAPSQETSNPEAHHCNNSDNIFTLEGIKKETAKALNDDWSVNSQGNEVTVDFTTIKDVETNFRKRFTENVDNGNGTVTKANSKSDEELTILFNEIVDSVKTPIVTEHKKKYGLGEPAATASEVAQPASMVQETVASEQSTKEEIVSKAEDIANSQEAVETEITEKLIKDAAKEYNKLKKEGKGISNKLYDWATNLGIKISRSGFASFFKKVSEEAKNEVEAEVFTRWDDKTRPSVVLEVSKNTKTLEQLVNSAKELLKANDWVFALNFVYDTYQSIPETKEYTSEQIDQWFKQWILAEKPVEEVKVEQTLPQPKQSNKKVKPIDELKESVKEALLAKDEKQAAILVNQYKNISKPDEKKKWLEDYKAKLVKEGILQ